MPIGLELGRVEVSHRDMRVLHISQESRGCRHPAQRFSKLCDHIGGVPVRVKNPDNVVFRVISKFLRCRDFKQSDLKTRFTPTGFFLVRATGVSYQVDISPSTFSIGHGPTTFLCSHPIVKSGGGKSVKTWLTGPIFFANIDQMNNKESRDGA